MEKHWRQRFRKGSRGARNSFYHGDTANSKDPARNSKGSARIPQGSDKKPTRKKQGFDKDVYGKSMVSP